MKVRFLLSHVVTTRPFFISFFLLLMTRELCQSRISDFRASIVDGRRYVQRVGKIRFSEARKYILIFNWH